MNCDDFQLKFQHWIDSREALIDPSMQQHTDHCESCRHQLQLWRTIETSLTKTDGRSDTMLDFVKRKSMLTRSIVAMAAACLLVVLVMRNKEALVANSDGLTSVESLSTDPDEGEVNLSIFSTSPQLLPHRWWNDIRDRDWVSQTMPTVRVVRDGVAPLGRSIQRAAKLLTTASREQTS